MFTSSLHREFLVIIFDRFNKRSCGKLLSEVFQRNSDYLDYPKKLWLYCIKNRKNTLNIVKIKFSCRKYRILTFFFFLCCLADDSPRTKDHRARSLFSFFLFLFFFWITSESLELATSQSSRVSWKLSSEGIPVRYNLTKVTYSWKYFLVADRILYRRWT